MLVLCNKALFTTIKTKNSATSSHEQNILLAIKALISNKIERILVVVSLLSNFVLTPTLFYVTPILIIEKYKHSTIEIGIAEAMFGIGMIFGSTYLCKILNNNFGVRLTTIISINLIPLGLLLILIINNLSALFLGLFFSGIGAVIFNINTTKIRCSATPLNLRNSFESIFLAICIIAIPIGISISTLIIESGMLEILLIIFSSIIFISAIAVFRSTDFKKVAILKDTELENYYCKLYPKIYQGENHNIIK